MISAPLDTIEGSIRGAQGCARENSSLVPVRLPPWAWRQTPDALTAETFRQASGVRLELISEASILELDLSATRIEVEGLDLPVHPSSVDLIVDDFDRGSETIDVLGLRFFGPDGDLVRTIEGPLRTLRFEGLEPVPKRLQMWLPANASVRLHDLRANAPVAPAPEAPPPWIHYGSSISHCSEARRPTETWPALAARATGVELVNLGVGGNCHLDQFVARVIRDAAADSISVKVGINIVGGDTLKYRTFLPAVHGFLDTVRDGHPDTPLLVVSPIFCPPLEDAQGPLLFTEGRAISGVYPAGRNALTLRRVRELLASLVEERRTTGDERLFYLDGLRLFGDEDVDELPDALHPSPAGYIRMGSRFATEAFGAGRPFAGVAQR